MSEPDIFAVFVKLNNAARSPDEQRRIGLALDAAVAFGMWRAMGGDTDGLTREELRALFFQKAGRL